MNLHFHCNKCLHGVLLSLLDVIISSAGTSEGNMVRENISSMDNEVLDRELHRVVLSTQYGDVDDFQITDDQRNEEVLQLEEGLSGRGNVEGTRRGIQKQI